MKVILDKIAKEKARLAKAKESADRVGSAILAEILEAMNQDNPGWDLRTTEESDDVILFFNKQSLAIADEISLNLSTGELEPVLVLTETGRKGLETLLEQVKRKKRKWLRIRTRFEEAMDRARESARRLDWQITEGLNK